MNKTERDDLIRLARLRAKQAKAEAGQRAKVLAAEVEDEMTAEYEARDELWSEAVAIAEAAAAKANDLIVARCVELGVPAKNAPRLALGWSPRSGGFADPRRRGELRKLAAARLDALTTTAKTMIDRKLLDTETALIAGGLESGEARDFLGAMPTAEELMPALSLDDLGVKTWQPPEGIAGELLTPSTPADRKRRSILRAIEANPDASDRRIAEVAGCDHKTVATYRRSGGETAAITGEIPGDEWVPR